MNLHEGHRKRLRERFIKEGAETFAPHNLLELLLFYAVPRKDTNETAHRLLAQFGSVKAVLTAPHEELCKVDGVSDNTAVLLRLCGEIGMSCFIEKKEAPRRLHGYEEIGEYLVDLYAGSKEETVYVLLLASDGALIKTMLVCNGGVNSISVKIRDIVAEAIRSNAPTAVLAHNHPGGTAFPSSDDLLTTQLLYKALAVNDIELLDHFVVTGNSYCCIMH